MTQSVPLVFDFILPWLMPFAPHILAQLQTQDWPLAQQSRLIVYSHRPLPLDFVWEVEHRPWPEEQSAWENCLCHALNQSAGGTHHWVVLLHPTTLFSPDILSLLATALESKKTLILTGFPQVRWEDVQPQLETISAECVSLAHMSHWLQEYPHPCQNASDWHAPQFLQQPEQISFPGGMHVTTPWPLAIKAPLPIDSKDWGAPYLNQYATRGQDQMALLTDLMGIQLTTQNSIMPSTWPLPLSLRPRAVYQWLQGCSPLQRWFFAHTFQWPSALMQPEEERPWDWPEQLARLQDLRQRGWDTAIIEAMPSLAPPEGLGDPLLQMEWADGWLQAHCCAAPWESVRAEARRLKDWWLTKYWPGDQMAYQMLASHPQWGHLTPGFYHVVYGESWPLNLSSDLPAVLISTEAPSRYGQEMQWCLTGLAGGIWIEHQTKISLPLLLAACLDKPVFWYQETQ